MADRAIINLQSLVQAIGANLKQKIGAVNVYNNPNQQNTKYPAWFINFVPSNTIDKPVMGRSLRSLTFDISYHEEINIPNLYDDYMEIADKLDEFLLFIDYPYSYQDEDENTVNAIAKIRTVDRHWTIDRNALHYMFTLPFHVTIWDGKDRVKMMRIEELNETVTVYEDWR